MAPVGAEPGVMPKHLRFAGLQRRTLRAYRPIALAWTAFCCSQRLRNFPSKLNGNWMWLLVNTSMPCSRRATALPKGTIFCQGSSAFTLQ